MCFCPEINAEIYSITRKIEENYLVIGFMVPLASLFIFLTKAIFHFEPPTMNAEQRPHIEYCKYEYFLQVIFRELILRQTLYIFLVHSYRPSVGPGIFYYVYTNNYNIQHYCYAKPIIINCILFF